jgi:hypothetical protein
MAEQEKTKYFPIVFIRGFAGSKSDVESAVSDPHRGFNLGSSIVKLINNDDSDDMAKALQHDFPGPLLRLIEDFDYKDAITCRFVNSRNEPVPGALSRLNQKRAEQGRKKADWRKTLWVFHLYKEEYFNSEDRPLTEGYAEKLALFLDQVRDACLRPVLPENATDAQKAQFDKEWEAYEHGRSAAFRINLVAHSMGGLVARCYLQNKRLFKTSTLRMVKPVLVNKLVTYGTPHQGIQFRRGLEFFEWIKDIFGPVGSDTFGEPRMREFLSLYDDKGIVNPIHLVKRVVRQCLLPSGKNPNQGVQVVKKLVRQSPLIYQFFKGPPLHTFRAHRNDLTAEKTLSIVGTNYQVYDVLFGMSSKSVGPRSDGLVRIDNAHICSGPRVFINCSHSGYMGLTNSEAGYQNLIRFLFGDIRYTLSLFPVEIAVDQLREQHQALDYMTIDCRLAIQGLPTYINRLTSEDKTALTVKLQPDGKPLKGRRAPDADADAFNLDDDRITLFTSFWDTRWLPSSTSNAEPCIQGAVDLRFEAHYKAFGDTQGIFRETRMEGEYFFNERLHLKFDPRAHLGSDSLNAQPAENKAFTLWYHWGVGKPDWHGLDFTETSEESIRYYDYHIPFPPPPGRQVPLFQSKGLCLRTSAWD